ncbi:hypothetical protein RMATCC62417_17956 [Rhizopus microsporus]|nr:hypothetical protein RMATCC62417_17956 [Rhizopus microsporus]
MLLHENCTAIIHEVTDVSYSVLQTITKSTSKSFRRRNKKQATSGNGKDDDEAEAVQGSSNESWLVISEPTSISAVDEKSTFDFDASFQFTVDGLQRHLLGKRLGDDKGKSSASRKQRRTTTVEEEGEDYEGQ